MYNLVSPYQPSGDQPQAIDKLSAGINNGEKYQVLLGATGTGKTFSIANVIKNSNKKTLVLAHNKTLASQLYAELQAFFPNNRVEYFVSYFDYYQPEAYVAGSDTYIEKTSQVNDEIDRLRHSATASLVEEDNVIVVASVSCIYGLGDPNEYKNLTVSLRVGQEINQKDVIKRLVDLQYTRSDMSLERLHFRVRGDIIDIVGAHNDQEAYRIEFFGDEIDKLSIINVTTGKTVKTLKHLFLFPASHYVVEPEFLKIVTKEIKKDLEQEVKTFVDQDKLVEAQRLEQRTNYDIEMMNELGYCNGIENYTRYMTGKKKGEPPYTLLDFFGDDWLLVVDESHVTLPQIRGMYEGDHNRKQTLVDYGFRLQAAIDNRPLNFDEFMSKVNQAIFISATPGDYELGLVNNQVVEQIIRPTNLLDPEIEIRPTTNQIDDIINEIKKVVPNKVLITTLTKKMAEDLTQYLQDHGIKVAYLHSDITTIDRVKIINDLRCDKYDCIVGINLLREGLDIPEVSRVLILDADKQGFLRSKTSLIQTIGRAARNSEGKVIMYADSISQAMQEAIDETKRRRDLQSKYNQEHHLSPISTTRKLDKIIDDEIIDTISNDKKQDHSQQIEELRKEMNEASKNLDFETAAQLRDLIFELEK